MVINRMLSLVLALFFLGCQSKTPYPSKSKNEQLFNIENWGFVNGDSSEVYTLKMNINNKTGELFGSHCFVIENGGKVDCADNQTTFRGRISNGLAKIKIKSFFSDDSLKCHFRYMSDSTILFEIDDDIGWTLFKNKMEFKKRRKLI